MVEIKLKKPNALIQIKALNPNQAVKQKRSLKSVLACFDKDD